MMEVAWGAPDYVASALIAVLLAIHARARASAWVRWGTLGAALFGALVLGGSVRFHVAVRNLVFPDPGALVPSVEAAGDPGLVRRVAEQRPVHPFPHAPTDVSVRTWRRDVRDALRTALFLSGFDPPGHVDVRVHRVETVDGIGRTLLSYQSHDGTEIPCFLCTPAARTGAGVLLIPGHGLGAVSLAGIAPDDRYKSGAVALARAGYVCLVPELRGFGMLGAARGHEHRLVAHNALLAGSLYKAEIVRDLAYARVVLAGLNGVDPERLAVAGSSYGGELALLCAALDDAFGAVIVHAHGDVGPEPGQLHPEGSPSAETSEPHGCHLIPGINRILLREDWFRLVSPRPLQLVRGAAEDAPGADALVSAVRAAYGAEGTPDAFDYEIVEGRHGFFPDAAVRFLDRWLETAARK